MTGRYRKKLLGLALGVGAMIGGAQAANAVTWTVSNVAMASNTDGSSPEQGSWGVLKTASSNPSDFTNSYAVMGDSGIGQIVLTVNNPGGGTFTVDSFCVDLYHHLTTADFYTDTVSSLTNMDTAKSNQLSALLQNVDTYIKTGSLGGNTTASAGTQADRSAAAQLAIWEIVNETSDTVYNVDASSGSFGLFGAMKYASGDTLTANAISDGNALLTAVKSASAPSGFTVALVRSNNNQTQIVYGAGASRLLGAVPEPATWGMMVLGFGLLGSAMRRKRDDAYAIA